MIVRLFFICCFLRICIASAQNNLIVIDENGQKFFLFVNDQQINDSAQSTVEAMKTYDDSCRIKAVFADKKIPDFESKVYLLENDKPVQNRDFTYSISQKRDKMKLKYISVNNSQSDTTAKPQSPEKKIATIFLNKEKAEEAQDRVNEKYPPPGPCENPVNDSALSKQIGQFRDEHIELNRIKDMKWFISHHCILPVQARKILELLYYERDKVKVAEFYYDYMPDKANFPELYSVLRYETEVQDLKKFYSKKTAK
jgi:hypothetical protein